MKVRLAVAVVLFFASSPLWAAKIPDDVRFAFEKSFKPKMTWAVVVERGIPTTSIYGVNGDQTGAHYSIDVIDGAWKTSEGLLDTDQNAVDFLRHGEIVELASISYKDNRIDMRMVSLESHKVTRGNWLLKDTKPEPVATNFKFFLPYPKSRTLASKDVPEVLSVIQRFLKPFRDEDSARGFSASLLAGGTRTTEKARAPKATVKAEIKRGMTALQVIDAVGKPEKEVSFENTTRWSYPDMTVVFEAGRVKEVKF